MATKTHTREACEKDWTLKEKYEESLLIIEYLTKHEMLLYYEYEEAASIIKEYKKSIRKPRKKKDECSNRE